MKHLVLAGIILMIASPLLAQKNKKEQGVPSIKQSYTRFSIFSFQDGRYVHKQTDNVWMDTFINLNPKTQKVELPGLGQSQTCKYEDSDFELFENGNGLQLVVIPILCSSIGNPDEKRILKIHCIQSSRQTVYLFSLGYADTKDLVLFHNYSDSEIGQLLTKEAIRFE